jgi:hypothetical protein
MINAAYPLILLLAPGGGVPAADEKPVEAPKEVRLADLLALPVTPYRVDTYLGAARSLQALGKEKASALLLELAAKEEPPNFRTFCLCRMLFQAKPKHAFFRPPLGMALGLPGDTTPSDWPLEPIEIVDGVPFFIPCSYFGVGMFEPGKYVQYCVDECDWSSFRFAPKSKEEKRKALEKLLCAPKLKGKLDKGEQDMFAAQIR